ncbi:receptor expression enhancing protein B [Leptinotarsa decemlineata]|uniref:receptor expression enhancing protein B n=1 Tax=Leptinotarsa decemlineata TaxID=7539 RepID=UPI000C251FC7|nr:receptor expression-enhancing protein 5-like [Leptinotarsa decemlineata]XP_023023438.1 receptor expression-enhancing protein 5-like [Leptinotarsa decemlineata]
MAQKFGEIKHQLDVSLHDSSKPWTSILEQAEKKTGLDRLYIFAGGIVLVGLWLVFGYFAQLVCNSVGFLYPAYMSIKAIESKSKDDDTKWLTYWVVFALFSIAEYFADFIVGWFPLYWLIKCIFMVWLMIPTGFNGSLILYNRIIKPYFLKHEHNIDDVVNKVKDSAHKVFDKRE